MTPSEQKRNLRRVVSERLKSMTPAEREILSADLRSRLAPFLATERKLAVALYMPLPQEVNLLPLIRQYPQHDFAFPRCQPEHDMQFHVVRAPERDFEPGKHNIPAPVPHLPQVSPAEFDFVIVPGVAFTTDGRRLGYGGGYYDRFLPRCTSAQLLAVAFPQQMVDDIPTEAHDLRIPRILTCGAE